MEPTREESQDRETTAPDNSASAVESDLYAATTTEDDRLDALWRLRSHSDSHN